MLVSRSITLILAVALALPGLSASEQASTAIQAPQFVGRMVVGPASDLFSGAILADQQASAYLAWAPPALEDAGGFTQTELTYDRAHAQLRRDPDQGQDEAGAVVNDVPSHAKIPEPAALALFGTTLVGIAYATRKRTRR